MQETLSVGELMYSDKFVRRFQRLSKRTRYDYLLEIENFRSLFDDKADFQSIYEYVMSRPKSRRNVALSAIKYLFKANDLPIPVKSLDFSKEEMPDSSEAKGIPYRYDEVLRFISGIKNRKIKMWDIPALTLAIVWGMRRVEITRFVPERDVDLENKRFYVRTAKGGEHRWHYIPDNLIPVFKLAKLLGVRYSIDALSSDKLRHYESAVGVVHISRRGWHGFRRTLVTLLLQNGVKVTDVHYFLRWKRKDAMVLKYYHPDPYHSDIEVLSKHPFVNKF